MAYHWWPGCVLEPFQRCGKAIKFTPHSTLFYQQDTSRQINSEHLTSAGIFKLFSLDFNIFILGFYACVPSHAGLGLIARATSGDAHQ
jgi:hypothetical protein